MCPHKDVLLKKDPYPKPPPRLEGRVEDDRSGAEPHSTAPHKSVILQHPTAQANVQRRKNSLIDRSSDDDSSLAELLSRRARVSG